MRALFLAVAVFTLVTEASRADQPRRPLVIVTSFPQQMFMRFKDAFEERHADIKVFVRSKKTSAAISFVEERPNEPVDLFWVSAPDAFEVLKSSGHLARAFDAGISEPSTLGGYPTDDRDGYYKGFAVSGYGILWNSAYLRRRDLPPPRSWSDLTDPRYRGHIAITAPSRSGTTHLIVETILQSKGWTEGWALLSALGGNLATVTARSFGVREGVTKGRFGIGATIDFFGHSAIALGAPVEFRYPRGTSFVPASIAVVKRAQNPEAARAFIEFLLSPSGQRLLFEPQISRLPVSPDAYADAPPGFPNPFEGELLTHSIVFDTGLSRRRYHLVNSLFDIMITYRLPALKRTWALIDQADVALNGRRRPALVEKLDLARTLAGSVPVSAEDVADDEFASSFVRRRPGMALPARQVEAESAWKRAIERNQREAQRLATEVVTALKAFEKAGD